MCDPCRQAAATYERDRQKRRYLRHGALTTDPLGSQRRLRALAALGWSAHILAAEVGTSAAQLQAIRNGRRVYIRTDTADRIAELYDRLHMTPGPSESARRWARWQECIPPLAWDDIDDPDEDPRGNVIPLHRSHIPDEAAVERLCAGDGATAAHSVDIDAAITRLRAEGLTFAQVATRLRRSPAFVEKRSERMRRFGFVDGTRKGKKRGSVGNGESRPDVDQDGSLTLDPIPRKEGSVEPKRTRPTRYRGAV